MKRILAWLMVFALVISVSSVVSAGGHEGNDDGTITTMGVARPGGV